MLTKNQLDHNWRQIQAHIQAAQEKRQSRSNLHPVAITKSVDAETMRNLYAVGLKRFGENRPKDFLAKVEALADLEIEWHYVGRLQTRPVRQIIDHIDYLHSLDRWSLVKEIQKRAKKPLKCFVQINISGEEQKAGLSPDETEAFIRQLADYDKIEVVGLMTMAPYDADEETLRQIFQQMYELQKDIADLKLSHAPCSELSMGMSQDYPIAIEEGATYVRIGTAFFQE